MWPCPGPYSTYSMQEGHAFLRNGLVLVGKPGQARAAVCHSVPRSCQPRWEARVRRASVVRTLLTCGFVCQVADPNYVYKWRGEAEAKMRAAGKGGMTDEQVRVKVAPSSHCNFLP